jgi:hypothetical protein
LPSSLRLEEGSGLAVPEGLVDAAGLAELGVGAVLHDGAALQHDDAVEGGHGGEAVCDDDRGAAAVVALTVIGLLNPPVYSTEIMGSNEDHAFDNTYKVSLADERYGNVRIVYIDEVEDYFVHADLKKSGKTVLILESPDGKRTEYDLSIEKDTYEMAQR